jgi:Gas vesicle synthesis protein GvpO
MAERRKTRSAGDVAEKRRPVAEKRRPVAEKRRPVAEKRRPVDDEVPEVLDEDEPEDFDEDGEPEEPDEEPQMLDDGETEASGGASLTASEAAKAALRQISELTEKQAEGITAVERTDDGWAVGIEVIEDRRVPSSADILATYETTIAADGELLSYRRIKRYPRGRGDGSKGS